MADVLCVVRFHAESLREIYKVEGRVALPGLEAIIQIGKGGLQKCLRFRPPSSLSLHIVLPTEHM